MCNIWLTSPSATNPCKTFAMSTISIISATRGIISVILANIVSTLPKFLVLISFFIVSVDSG